MSSIVIKLIIIKYYRIYSIIYIFLIQIFKTSYFYNLKRNLANQLT